MVDVRVNQDTGTAERLSWYGFFPFISSNADPNAELAQLQVMTEEPEGKLSIAGFFIRSCHIVEIKAVQENMSIVIVVE